MNKTKNGLWLSTNHTALHCSSAKFLQFSALPASHSPPGVKGCMAIQDQLHCVCFPLCLQCLSSELWQNDFVLSCSAQNHNFLYFYVYRHWCFILYSDLKQWSFTEFTVMPATLVLARKFVTARFLFKWEEAFMSDYTKE